MIESVSRAVFPFALILAFGLWIKGYSQVGDGFSAGACAGLGAVVQYLCLDVKRAGRHVGARWAWLFLSGGLVLSLAVLLGPIALGFAPVTHFPAPGAKVLEFGIVKVHTALVLDAGIALLVYGAVIGSFDRLFLGSGGEP